MGTLKIADLGIMWSQFMIDGWHIYCGWSVNFSQQYVINGGFPSKLHSSKIEHTNFAVITFNLNLNENPKDRIFFLKYSKRETLSNIFTFAFGGRRLKYNLQRT